jgi:hypothetical protein
MLAANRPQAALAANVSRNRCGCPFVISANSKSFARCFRQLPTTVSRLVAPFQKKFLSVTFKIASRDFDTKLGKMAFTATPVFRVDRKSRSLLIRDAIVSLLQDSSRPIEAEKCTTCGKALNLSPSWPLRTNILPQSFGYSEITSPPTVNYNLSQNGGCDQTPGQLLPTDLEPSRFERKICSRLDSPQRLAVLKGLESGDLVSVSSFSDNPSETISGKSEWSCA